MNEHLQQHIDRILNKLLEARTRGLACFGSEKHGFRLNPPLDEAELRRFETAHAVELPAGYRAFLQRAGNGGAGPYYGIDRLDERDDIACQVLDDVPADFLARPNPLRPGYNHGLETRSEAGLLAAWRGTLSLGTQGCSYDMQLIVSGPYRGRVAYSDSDGLRPPYVVRDPDFLAWYERWLDELLRGYETSWFGFGPAGGEAEFIAIINDDCADDELKGEAAWAFSRLPHLSDAAAAQVTAYLGHRLQDVRAGSCGAIRRFAIRAGIEAAAGLLADPASEVRRQAVWTLMQLEPDRWADAVRRRVMYDETDESVARSALSKLNKSKHLAHSDLLHLIESSRQDGIRASAVYHLDWSAMGAESRDLATRLLNDQCLDVRRWTILGLSRSQIPGRAALLIDRLEKEDDANIIDFLLKDLGKLADPAASPALLKFARADDDFHRLNALESLIKIGDGRAREIAAGMLEENRKPVRRDAKGFKSHVETIGVLVSRMLRR